MEFPRKIFTLPIRAGFMMAVSAAILLCGYEFARSSINTLFKDIYGVANLPLGMALMPILLYPILWGYGKTLTKFGTRKTLRITMIGSGIFFLVAYAMLKMGWVHVLGPLYIFKEAYIVLIIEQYWSYLNSSLSGEEAKKFNGLALATSTFGAIMGGLLVNGLAVKYGAHTMVLICGLLFIPSCLLGDFAYRLYSGGRIYENEEEEIRKMGQEASETKDNIGIKRIKENPLLFRIMWIIIGTQMLATVLSLDFQNFLQLHYPDVDHQTSVSGLFYAVLNSVALFFQLFASPLVLKYFAIESIQLCIPFLHLCTVSAMLIFPNSWASGLSLIIFKGIDYSLFRSSKEIFYMPLNFAERFRTKEFIDIFCYRMSKTGTSILVTGGQQLGLVFTTNIYGLMGLGAIFLWINNISEIIKMKKKREQRS
jgi:ATP/ADP translocase